MTNIIIDGKRILDHIEPTNGQYETIDNVKVYFDIWQFTYLRADNKIVEYKVKTYWDSSLALSESFNSGNYKNQIIRIPKGNVISQIDLENVNVLFINIKQDLDI